MKIAKILPAIVGFTLVPAAGTLAQDEDFEEDSVLEKEAAPSEFSQMQDDSGWKFSIGVEGFYAKAANTMFSGSMYGGSDETKVDLIGGNIRLEFLPTKPDMSIFSPEFFLVFGYGQGEDNSGAYKREVDFYQLALGAGLRAQIAKPLVVFLRAEIGVNYMDAMYGGGPGWYYESCDDTGLMFGLGCGIEYSLNRHHAVFVSYDYLESTARAECEHGMRLNAQDYHMFSIGYKYTF